MKEQIKIRLFPRGKTDNKYHVGNHDIDKDELINLKDVTFFVFIHKNNPDDRMLVIRKNE